MKVLLVIKMKNGLTKSKLVNSDIVMTTVNLLKNATNGSDIKKTIKIAPVIIFNKIYPSFEKRIVELFGEISVEELFNPSDELDGLSPFIYSNPTDNFVQYIDDYDEYDTMDELLNLYEEYIRARWPFNGVNDTSTFASYDAEIREAVLDIWPKFEESINENFPGESSNFLLTYSNDFDGLRPIDSLNPSDYFINYVDEELGFEMETYLDALDAYIIENL